MIVREHYQPGRRRCKTNVILLCYQHDNQYVIIMFLFIIKTGDSLRLHSGMQFSTYDQDHDANNENSCAELYQSGWWFRACIRTNLNGLYLHNEPLPHALSKGVTWTRWRGKEFSLKKSEMKMRPVSSVQPV